MKCNKSPGCDDVNTRVVQAVVQCIVDPLSGVYYF